MDNQKRRFGDRKDAKRIRNTEPMQLIVAQIYPNRCDNEAFQIVRVDIERLYKYLKNKNNGNTEFKYTIFQAVTTAALKAITLRPKMNRFIANGNLFQRNDVSAAFVVKRDFSDEAPEALAIIRSDENDTFDTLHKKLEEQINLCKSDIDDPATKYMSIVTHLPGIIQKNLVRIVRKLEKHGKCPAFLTDSDPYYSSIVLSNLGSIKLKCGYHHLTNWGTTSLFGTVGGIKHIPVEGIDGKIELHRMIEIGITIDERIADGYYFSKSIQLLKKILQNPELLDSPMNEEVK